MLSTRSCNPLHTDSTIQIMKSGYFWLFAISAKTQMTLIFNIFPAIRANICILSPAFTAIQNDVVTNTWVRWTTMSNKFSLLSIDGKTGGVPAPFPSTELIPKTTCHDGSVSPFLWLFLTQDGRQWEILKRSPSYCHQHLTKKKKKLGNESVLLSLWTQVADKYAVAAVKKSFGKLLSHYSASFYMYNLLVYCIPLYNMG